MQKIALAVGALLFVFTSSKPAYAYLDPGTVSLGLQAVLASVAGLAATYRLWFYKVKTILFGFKGKKDAKNEKNKSNRIQEKK